MDHVDALTGLKDPVVVGAFRGWNDASDVATDATCHLMKLAHAATVASVDPDPYYDFTHTRPSLGTDADGRRTITWPSVEVRVGRLHGRDFVFLVGPEPSYHWRQFAAALTEVVDQIQPTQVILLGSMLTDIPHRRPTQVTLNATDYEGPTGIVSVLAEAIEGAGHPVTAMWAALPHYLAEAPNPKATLAMLGRIEDLLDITLDTGSLPMAAAMWEREANSIVESDPDIEEYVSSLERTSDTHSPDQISTQLAEEAQRFLRRRDR